MSANHVGDTHETVNHWLASLDNHQQGMALDQQGKCFLVADNELGLAVSCSKGSQQVAILAHLISLPIPLSVRLYEELLALNLNLDFTAGAHLYFDKQTRAIGILFSRDVALLDELSFKNTLTNFKDKAREVKSFIEDLLYGDSGTVSAGQRMDYQLSSETRFQGAL